MNTGSRIIYRVNDLDEIIYTNPEWSRFAAANNGSALASEHIIGRSLWDFINDETVRNLYRAILQRVRQGETARFNLRCDSPECRRFLEMSITLQAEGDIQFETFCLSVESRRSQKILELDASRSGEMLSMCAWCNRIKVSEEVWEEVEQAVIKLGFFDAAHFPPISHGMCKHCYQRVSGSIFTQKSVTF